MYLIVKLMLFFAVLRSLNALSCEVSFRRRIWYHKGSSLSQLASCSSNVTTTIPSTSTRVPTTLAADMEFYQTDLDVKYCQLSSKLAAKFACGSLLYIDTACPSYTIEYLIKDCVGYSVSNFAFGCQLSTLEDLGSAGTFFFEAENTFKEAFMNYTISSKTEFSACFCRDDFCNKNETLVVISPDSASSVGTTLLMIVTLAMIIPARVITIC